MKPAIALLIAICFSGPWTGTPSGTAHSQPATHPPVPIVAAKSEPLGPVIQVAFDGGTMQSDSAFATFQQVSGTSGKFLAPGTIPGQMVLVLMNVAGNGELFASGIAYSEDGTGTTARAPVLLIWLGGDWQLVTAQGVFVN